MTISGNENKLRVPVSQSRLVFCAVCGMRWYRAGDYRGEVCIECYKWGELEEVKIHYRRQGLGLCPCGEVIKGEGLCMKCSWEKLWFGEAE